MAMTAEEQEAFLASLGLGDEEEIAQSDEPEPQVEIETPDDLVLDWSTIEGLSLTAKADYDAAYRILFDMHKRNRHAHPGWNKLLHSRIVRELNQRRQASKSGHVKAKVKASSSKRAANIAADVAQILKAAGVNVDDEALDAAIATFVKGE